jgi:uncharacterized protein DUF3168
VDARQAIERALNTLLGADATLLALATGGVFIDPVPPGAMRPMVVVAVQAPQADTYTLRLRVEEVTDYQIKSITDSTSKVLGQQIAERVDQLLNDANPALEAGWQVMSIRRRLAVDYAEVPTATDQPIRHIGGIYRFEVTQP